MCSRESQAPLQQNVSVKKNEKKISLAKTAALAAYAHGKAGEAAEEKSSASYVTASEIIRGLQSI